MCRASLPVCKTLDEAVGTEQLFVCNFSSARLAELHDSMLLASILMISMAEG